MTLKYLESRFGHSRLRVQERGEVACRAPRRASCAPPDEEGRGPTNYPGHWVGWLPFSGATNKAGPQSGVRGIDGAGASTSRSKTSGRFAHRDAAGAVGGSAGRPPAPGTGAPRAVREVVQRPGRHVLPRKGRAPHDGGGGAVVQRVPLEGRRGDLRDREGLVPSEEVRDVP